jgi:hypothetical protein
MDALRAIIDGVLDSGSGSFEQFSVFAGMARSCRPACLQWWGL